MQQDNKSNEEANDIKRKLDEEIKTCFEAAKQKIGRLLTTKKQVIKDLARELERLGRPVDDIQYLSYRCCCRACCAATL